MNRLARVMLVEDNHHDVELFKILLLEEAGIRMELEVAGSGDEVLSRLCSTTQPLPDLILLDVNLPRMDGFEILQKIREEMQLEEVPVSMLSTSDDEYDIERAMKNGAYYMKKPANVPQMQALVQAVSSLLFQQQGAELHLMTSAS